MLPLLEDNKLDELSLQDDISYDEVLEALAEKDDTFASLAWVYADASAYSEHHARSQPSKTTRNQTVQLVSEQQPAVDNPNYSYDCTNANFNVASAATTPPTTKETKQEKLRARNRRNQQVIRQRQKVRYRFWQSL